MAAKYPAPRYLLTILPPQGRQGLMLFSRYVSEFERFPGNLGKGQETPLSDIVVP